MNATHVIETALGRVTFAASVVSKESGEAGFTIQTIEFVPELPKGMSVKRCRAVIFCAHSKSGLMGIDFTCTLRTRVRGDADSGECLDAQSWFKGSKSVMMGTEDSEALSSRMPQLMIEPGPLYPVEYKRDGFKIHMDEVSEGVEVSLHFVVVEKDNPEAEDCSAFFAAGISHKQLLLKANQALQRTR